MLTGSCLCGAVAFEVATPLSWLVYCHCSLCRKAQGAAFGSYIGTSARGVRLVRGEDAVVHYATAPGSDRPFCAGCGSRVPSSWRGETSIAAGALDGAFATPPARHIFAGSKAPWHAIADALPRSDGPSPGAAPIDTQRATEPRAGTARGACLCGAVAFECDLPLASGDITCCHCSRCRKARGTAHASNTFVAGAAFRWLRGEERVRAFKLPEAARFTQAFCGACGAPQPVAQPALARVVIPCGAFEDDPGVREARHIFVASRAPWFEIADDLPQYEAGPPQPAPPAAGADRT